MKKEVIAYVHSHWDREWYREFEIFRMRLLRVFDNVLDMLEKGTLPSFYFDGQTVAMLDYLEIRPEKKSVIKKLIHEKKLFIGPFYGLTDEYLTDENCFRKNLEIGLKTALEYGCEDFVGYFADTFGHSASTIPILNEYKIDTAVVWRGVSDIPSEFEWGVNIDGQEYKINTINLRRGYFNDVFSTPWTTDKKAEFLKNNLDKISEKSGDVILLPIGADHLGVETDILKQVEEMNKLLDDYEIKIGTIFEYISKVKNRFSEYKIEGELRDNSNTFILEGCYSSRLDIKKLNIEACHKLDIAESMVKYLNKEQYLSLIEYGYKLLLQNQAHDSICGCSTDDVHSENIIRYKKVLQIAESIIDEIRLEQDRQNSTIINLSDRAYSGVVEFKSTNEYPYQKIKRERGFDKNLLTDTQKIPVTEDYTDIYTYCTYLENIEGENYIASSEEESDVFITDNCIGNSKIFLIVENNEIRVGNKNLRFIDFIDNGDSYNTGYIENDCETEDKILSSKILMEGDARSSLGIELQIKEDFLHLTVSLDKYSPLLKFEIKWNNTHKNHLLQAGLDTGENILKTYSEDFNNIIEREFNPEWNPRNNLPKEKGIEVKTNTAPMHRGVLANGVGFVTKGITQYEVCRRELRIPILRATGLISNPKNPARTTPAGPPVEVKNLQQLGENKVEFYIFLGDNLKENIDTVFHKCVII